MIKRNRSNKTYSARLTRWLDRLDHFSINVSHRAGKRLALTHYLRRNPSAPPQADDAYEEEYVINSIIPHYKFMTKDCCLSNNVDQSKSETLHNKQKQCNTREQNAIACLNRPTISCVNSLTTKSKLIMDANTINKLELPDPSAETRNLIVRWRDIVKPSDNLVAGGKNTTNPDFLEMKDR